MITAKQSAKARVSIECGSVAMTGVPVALSATEKLFVRLLLIPSASTAIGDSESQPFTVGAGQPFALETPAGTFADMGDLWANATAAQTVKYLRFY